MCPIDLGNERIFVLEHEVAMNQVACILAPANLISEHVHHTPAPMCIVSQVFVERLVLRISRGSVANC